MFASAASSAATLLTQSAAAPDWSLVSSSGALARWARSAACRASVRLASPVFCSLTQLRGQRQAGVEKIEIGHREPPDWCGTLTGLPNLRPLDERCQPYVGNHSGDGIAGSCSRRKNQAIPRAQEQPGRRCAVHAAWPVLARGVVTLQSHVTELERRTTSLGAEQRIRRSAQAMTEREVLEVVRQGRVEVTLSRRDGHLGVAYPRAGAEHRNSSPPRHAMPASP